MKAVIEVLDLALSITICLVLAPLVVWKVIRSRRDG